MCPTCGSAFTGLAHWRAGGTNTRHALVRQSSAVVAVPRA